jgi:hypothetical protein
VVPKVTYNFNFDNIDNPFATRAKTAFEEGEASTPMNDPTLEPEDEDEESNYH